MTTPAIASSRLASESTGLSLAEKAGAAAALFLGTTPFTYFLGGSSALDPTGNVDLQRVWLVVYGLFIVLALRHLRDLRSLLAHESIVVTLTTLAMVSALWSSAPSITGRRGGALALSTFVALYLARRLSISALGELLSWVLAGAIVLSFAMVLLEPRYGLDPSHAGSWRGIFETKNDLGRLGALATLFWLLRLYARVGRRGVAVVVATLACVTTWYSGSRTSLVVAVSLVALLALLPVLRASASAAVSGVAFVLAGGAAVAVWGGGSAVLHLLGATSTLTGRTAIWHAVWHAIRVHPMWGYGYGAFWLGWNGPSAGVWQQLGAMPPHAHNGVLEVWLELGAVGVLLLLAWLILSLHHAWRAMRSGAVTDAWPLLFLVAVALGNVTEVSFMTRNAFIWMASLAAASAAARVGFEPASTTTNGGS